MKELEEAVHLEQKVERMRNIGKDQELREAL